MTVSVVILASIAPARIESGCGLIADDLLLTAEPTTAGEINSDESSGGNAMISLVIETKFDVSRVDFSMAGFFKLTEAITTPVRMTIISMSIGITAGRWPWRFFKRGFRL